MTDGLITRIGKWMDRKWEMKATESQLENVRQLVQDRWNNLENAQIKDKVEIVEKMAELKEDIQDEILPIGKALADTIKQLSALRGDVEKIQLMQIPDTKEFTDLKTRMEKIELYAGMTRKVDPTKPPVVKSAFAM